MARRTLNVVIAGDTKGLNKAFTTTETRAKRLEGTVGKASSSMARNLTQVGKIAGVALGAGVVVGLKKSADAAIEAEKSQAKLRAQLEASNISFSKHREEIDRTITAHSKLSGFDDEDLADSFTNIVRVTGDVSKSLKLTGLAADFARAKNMDVAKAGEIVAKVAGGNTGILSRYGLSMDKGATAAEALATLQKKFGGQAEAYGKTTAGAIDRMNVSFENLGESVGGIAAPALATAAESLSGFLDTLTTSSRPAQFADSIKGAFGGAKDAVDDLVDSFKGFKATKGGTGAALGATFAEAFKKINWTSIAKTMGDGISAAFKAGGSFSKGVQDGIGAAMANVDGRKLLSGLLRVVAEAIDALFSPSFWIENFKEIFAVVTIAIPVAKILKIPGATALYNWISKPFFSAVGKLAGGFARAMGGVATTAFRAFSNAISGAFPGVISVIVRFISRVVEVLGKLPGRTKAAGGRAMTALGEAIGEGAAKVVTAMSRIVGSILRTLDRLMLGIPSRLAKALAAGTRKIGEWASNFATAGVMIGERIVSGIVKGITSTAGKIGSAITGGLGAAKDFVFGKGEGIGKEMGTKFGAMPRGGSISGSLMGAKAGMRPIAVMGQRFGLHATSGLRPGAVTSSGNPSWHGTGEALDMGGSAAGMMGFAKMMRARFGSRLAELIYTPMGAGISNGRPHTFTGKVAADHYDHVHVAMDLGRPGQGDGPGRRKQASGIGVAAAAARAAGFKGASLVQALAIAGAESGYNVNAQNLKYPDHSIGLWQINQLAHKQKYGSDARLKNPVANAKAAWAISSGGKNWGPWSTWGNQAYKKYLGQARIAATESRGQGARDAITNQYGRGGSSGGGGGGSTPEKVNAFEAAVAPADLAIAQATARAGADPERGSATAARLSWALRDKRTILGKRIRKIRRALKKKGIRPATKLRLQTELASLIGEHSSLGTQAKELVTPEALEPDEVVVPDLPSHLDFLNRDIAQATLTGGTEDDIAAATALRDFRAQQLAFARGGDPRTEAEFIEAFKSAEDALKALTDTTQEQTDAMKAHTEALDGVKLELKRQSDIAQAVQSTESFQIKKYLADVLSGQIGGYGVARAMTPGAGREFVW